MLINPDFRTLLQQVGNDPGGRQFKVRGANRFEILIRPSGNGDLGVGFAAEDCERWDVALRAPDRTHATPETHPPLFPESAWPCADLAPLGARSRGRPSRTP